MLKLDNTRDILRHLDTFAFTYSDLMLVREEIESYSPDLAIEKSRYDEFNGQTAIQRKVRFNDSPVNNKISSGIRSRIVNEAVGYVVGIPIVYKLNMDAYSGQDDQNYINHKLQINRFVKRNNLDDANPTTIKNMTIAGRGARLLYIDRDKQIRVRNIDPWTVICVYDDEGELAYSIRHFEDYEFDNGKKVKVQVAELYDSKNVYYLKKTKDGNYLYDEAYENNPQEHGFDYVPLFEVYNNDEGIGDFERSRSMIDAIDKLLSLRQDDGEEFTNAFLFALNMNTTPASDSPEDVIMAKQIINAIRDSRFAGVDEDGNSDKKNAPDLKYVTKVINDTFIQNQLTWLMELIYSVSESVDYKSFSGAETGIARQFKMLPLKNKVNMKSRKFKAMESYMWRVVCGYWKKYNKIDINPDDIQSQITINIPVDTGEELDWIAKGKGLVSDETLFSLVSFIDDPLAEIERIQKEKDAYGISNLDGVNTNE